jgi:hypothetical protein
MTRLRIALLFSLAVLLLVVGTVVADDDDFIPVRYTDTESRFNSPARGDTPVIESVGVPLILNGAFDLWTGNTPDYWNVWAQSKAGWETVHMGPADLARSADGSNNALSFFIRHTGGDGGFYSGVYQQMNNIPVSGYYFISVSEAIWYNDDRETAEFNSVAWYAITKSADPFEDTAAWRELDPYAIQCVNSFEVCNYAGRDETVWIDPGDYFHLIVAQKFPVFNASTVFVIDDVSVVPADGTTDQLNGYYDWVDESRADVKWHWQGEDCPTDDCEPVEVTWDRTAAR